MLHTSRVVLVVVVALFALVLAACGGTVEPCPTVDAGADVDGAPADPCAPLTAACVCLDGGRAAWTGPTEFPAVCLDSPEVLACEARCSSQ